MLSMSLIFLIIQGYIIKGKQKIINFLQNKIFFWPNMSTFSDTYLDFNGFQYLSSFYFQQNLILVIINTGYIYLMLIVLALLLKTVLSNQLTKNHTVIGIYSHSLRGHTELLPNGTQLTHVSHKSLIPVSFVKFVEMSGARVIPLFAFKDQSYFDEILPKINGVMFPGGNTHIDINDKWTQNTEYIMKYAMNQTKKGNPFPIWGICKGMQQMVYLTSGYDSNSTSKVQGQLRLLNTLQIQPNNTIFIDFPQYLLNSIQYGKGILYFHHYLAVTREYYTKSRLLQQFWNVESYTTSPFNQSFISAIRAKNYPFFGVQFHPQKIQFQWMVDADRSENAVEISQILSNRFVEIARRNTNKLTDNDQLIRLSIFNYQTHKFGTDYIAVYYFDEITNPIDSFAHDRKLTRQ